MTATPTHELLSVLEALETAHRIGRQAALATIVGARGSTYRREGARLFVTDGGGPVGNISGGCLEADIADVARTVMRTGKTRLVTYDLTADDEAVWGWGLGCNGAIDVFVEPADTIRAMAGSIRRVPEGEAFALITVVDSAGLSVAAGSHVLARAEGIPEGSLGHPIAEDAARRAARVALAENRSRMTKVDAGEGELRLFVEAVEPALRLIVCGAGHDAISLVDCAARLGWHVAVVDDRREFLTRERFPGASELVHVDKAGDAAAATGAGRWTRVVVMSHNYLRDLDYLRSFLGTETSYLGVLGPRRRLDRLLADLWAQGVPPSPEDIAKVHGPAGLDLGADGPEEIALAIMAEVLAIRRGRRGGFLRERTRPLHEVLDQSGRAHARASDRASSRPPIHPERRAPGLGR